MRVHRFDNAPRPMAWLPNRDGYRFIGITHEKKEIECVVEKGPDGLHRVADGKLMQLCGWRPLPIDRSGGA